MKVLCIDNGARKSKISGQIRVANNLLEEGKVYTQIEAGISPIGIAYIVLAEVKSNMYKGSFFADRFVPLSEVDEMELVNERELQNA